MEKYTELKQLLNGKDSEENINIFVNYCQTSEAEVDKQKPTEKKNKFYYYLTAPKLADIFLKVKSQGLTFDGKHITIQSTGISYDFVAYKNKMLVVYPESKVDLQLVYKGDIFSFAKESGVIKYSHTFKDPFNQKDSDIIGGYCVIKNRRGEFITLMDNEDLAKHRKIAKLDAMWVKWFKEMCYKTIIKKAIKYHFDDVFQDMEVEDNKAYDLEALGTRDVLKELSKAKAKDEIMTLWKSLSESEQLKFKDAFTQKKESLKVA
jgi:recombinational DNA repair protein RecT